jgi:hypothetical protein
MVADLRDRERHTGRGSCNGANKHAFSQHSWLTDRIVTVKVGPQEHNWMVHEKLLVSQSEFFREQLKDGATEIKLPEDDPRIFGFVVRWLYGTTFLPAVNARNFRFQVPDEQNKYTVRD